jgi:hypothetical protein
MATSSDPTLDTLMSDPLILTLMKADNVDPVRLKAKFHRIGADIARRRRERSDKRLFGSRSRALSSGRQSRPASPAGGIW